MEHTFYSKELNTEEAGSKKSEWIEMIDIFIPLMHALIIIGKQKTENSLSNIALAAYIAFFKGVIFTVLFYEFILN